MGDLGENYYGHVMEHVASDTERRARGETPGALSYSERISRKYCGSDRERSTRAKTEAFEREAMREAIRATSEIRRDLTPAPAPRTEEERQASRYIDEAHRRADQVITRHRSQVRDIAEDTNRTVSDMKSHTRRYEDNIPRRWRTSGCLRGGARSWTLSTRAARRPGPG